jgi:hypothetical protein
VRTTSIRIRTRWQDIFQSELPKASIAMTLEAHSIESVIKNAPGSPLAIVFVGRSN